MNPQPISRRNALKSSIATVAGSMVPAAVFAQNAAPEPSVGTPRALPQQQETTESAPKRAERQLIQQPTATMLGRTGEEAATWERITRELGTSLQFTSDGKATGELSDELQRIEKGFVFRAARNDSDYVWLHVEPLIDQAADLLDRGLQDRANWDEMSVKMFDLLLELKEFAELDQIHQEEERVGLYSTPAKQSLAEHAAELTYQQGEERVRAAVEKVLADYFSAPVKDKQSKASQGLAWLGGRAAYFFDNQNFKGYFPHTWDGATGEVSGLAQGAAATVAGFALDLQQKNLEIQREATDVTAKVAGERVPGLRARADWEALNADFLRRRTLVSRRLEEIKARAATDADGVLNYAKRLRALKKRFHNDFRDALARMNSVQRGLRDIYGYTEPLPADSHSIQYFDDCLLWARNVIQWLIRFSRLEQNLILPVSVREMVGETEWRAGLAAGFWCFALDESVLPDARHVRLRGISASVEGVAARDRTWRFNVVTPRCAIYRHLDSDVVVEVDQTIVPPIELGRVTHRESNREPDTVGASVSFNASPYGMWSVKLLGSIGPRINGNASQKSQRAPVTLDDVYLDLALAFRTQRSASSHSH